MSEERFDRLENQLIQVIQAVSGMQQNMTVVQQNMATKQELAGLVQIVTTGFASLNERVDRLDASFADLAQHVNDINVDLTVNEKKTEDNARKTRRINQRLMEIEKRDEEV